MLRRIKDRYRRWRSAKHPIPDRLWSAALRTVPYAKRLTKPQRLRLRELTTLFLLDKHFSTAHGFELTPAMRVRIAVKACIPILELGLDYYENFKGIVLYPGDFRAHDQYMDEAGVLHERAEELCGQSLDQGPIILSWSTLTAERAGTGRDLVIHECAHKLDILNGDADGFPPLPPNLSPRRWTHAFSSAYEKFQRAIDAGQKTRLDPYAAEDAAEFFAVASETFFTRPDILFEDFPEIYSQLASFYRQDPHSSISQ